VLVLKSYKIEFNFLVYDKPHSSKEFQMIKLILTAVLLTVAVTTAASSVHAEEPSTSMNKAGQVFQDIRNGRYEEHQQDTYEIFDAQRAEEMFKNSQIDQADQSEGLQEPDDQIDNDEPDSGY
jgi:hypothetical protein